MKNPRVIALLVASFLGGYTQFSGALGKSEYWVSVEGRDQWDGSRKHPWRTIQHAADSVGEGSVVHVLPGTYNETIHSRPSGNASARIRFVSVEKWGAKIVSESTGAGSWAWRNDGSYVDIEGFDITGRGANGVKNHGSYTRITGNHVHDVPAPGCLAGGGITEGGYQLKPLPSHNEYYENVINNVGGEPGSCHLNHGLYLGLPYAIARHNTCHHNGGRGIQLYHSATNATVDGNVIYKNGWGIVVDADIKAGYMNNDSVVAGNLVFENLKYGIYRGYGFGSGNQIKRNLVCGNGKDWGVAIPHSDDVPINRSSLEPFSRLVNEEEVCGHR